jgi:hypothetical protein
MLHLILRIFLQLAAHLGKRENNVKEEFEVQHKMVCFASLLLNLGLKVRA